MSVKLSIFEQCAMRKREEPMEEQNRVNKKTETLRDKKQKW